MSASLASTGADRPGDVGQGDAWLPDLAARWRRARLAALRQVLGATTDDAADESALARTAAERDRDAALRLVYDNSRRLGVSFVRATGRALGPDEVARLLEGAGVPCVTGSFQRAVEPERPEAGPHARLGRTGCSVGGAAVCDHFREAQDGLALGVSGGKVAFARHRSFGAGDDACVDVLFERDDEAGRHPLRLGPIPAPVAALLESARRALGRMDSRAQVEFLGLSEGLLYFTLEESDRGPGALALGPMLERQVARRLPSLRLVDASPRAVLGSPA